jgi:hypothetical protein
MTAKKAHTRIQGFAHVEIIIIAVVTIGLGGAVVFSFINSNNQKNAVQRQAEEQRAADSLKASNLEKAAKLAEENKKIEAAKKAEETAKQTAPTPTPSAPPSAPQPSAPSSTAYNSPMDNFEQLDPETAYVVNPNGAKIYAGYFTNEVVKTLPYGTKLKVHRQDGNRAAADGIAGEPAEADWAIDPKDVRRSL